MSHDINHSNEAFSPPFQYERLDLETNTFRFLRILPGSDEDVISCEMVVKGCTCPPGGRPDFGSFRYSALSYEWGNAAQPTHWIRVNGSHLQVRHNLFTFLHTARARLETGSDLHRHVWIDAICINQEDDREKEHQVQRMRTLYRLATTVFVWLGPKSSTVIDAGADELCQLGEQLSPLEDTLKRGSEGIPIQYELLNKVADQMLDPAGRALPALIEICEKSYWHRLWIVQAIYSAVDGRLMLGNHMFSWTLIRHGMLTGSLRRPGLRTSSLWKSAGSHIVTGLMAVEKFLREEPIFMIVARFMDNQCSLIHDKVFAVMGLCRSGRSLRVDYSLSTAELFWRLVYNRPERINVKQLIAANTVRKALHLSFDALELFLCESADGPWSSYTINIGARKGRSIYSECGHTTYKNDDFFVSEFSESQGTCGFKVCDTFDLHGTGLPTILVTIHVFRDPQKPDLCRVVPVTHDNKVFSGFAEEASVTGLFSSLSVVDPYLRVPGIGLPPRAYLLLLLVVHNLLESLAEHGRAQHREEEPPVDEIHAAPGTPPTTFITSGCGCPLKNGKMKMALKDGEDETDVFSPGPCPHGPGRVHVPFP
jgi:hypothetical protein